MLQKVYFSNNYFFLLSIYVIMYYDFQKNNKQLKLFSTFIIRTTIIKNEVPIIIDNS